MTTVLIAPAADQKSKFLLDFICFSILYQILALKFAQIPHFCVNGDDLAPHEAYAKVEDALDNAEISVGSDDFSAATKACRETLSSPTTVGISMACHGVD